MVHDCSTVLKRNCYRLNVFPAKFIAGNKETRNMLLGDGEKVIFVIKWQRTWLDYVPPLMSCGRWNSQAMKWII